MSSVKIVAGRALTLSSLVCSPRDALGLLLLLLRGGGGGGTGLRGNRNLPWERHEKLDAQFAVSIEWPIETFQPAVDFHRYKHSPCKLFPLGNWFWRGYPCLNIIFDIRGDTALDSIAFLDPQRISQDSRVKICTKDIFFFLS